MSDNTFTDFAGVTYGVDAYYRSSSTFPFGTATGLANAWSKGVTLSSGERLPCKSYFTTIPAGDGLWHVTNQFDPRVTIPEGVTNDI